MKQVVTAVAIITAIAIGCNSNENNTTGTNAEATNRAAEVTTQNSNAVEYDTIPVYDVKGEIVGDTIIPKS